MKLSIRHNYLLDRDRRRLLVTVIVVFLGTLASTLWLNLNYTKYEGIHLNKGSPPFRDRTDISSVTYIGGQKGVGWPWPASWTYEVDGVEYQGWGDVHPWRNVFVGIAIVLIVPTLVLLMLGAAIWDFRKRLYANGKCCNCRYNLRGSVGAKTCPECGQFIYWRYVIVDDVKE